MDLRTKGAWIQASPLARLGEMVREQGLDWGEILRPFNLDADAAVDPDTLVPVETMLAIFNGVAEITRNDVQILDLFYATPVGFNQGYDYMGLYAPTVRDALKNWARITGSRSNTAKTAYSEDAQGGKLEWSLPSHYAHITQFSFAFLGWAIKRIELILDNRWEGITVHISSPKPKSSSPLLEKYGTRVKYNQADHGVIVPKALLDQAPPMADPILLGIVDQYVFRIIKERSAASSPFEKILDAMSDKLQSGDCSIKTVASEVGMSSRSLQRLLEMHDTSYRDLLLEVRRSMAEKYLLETELPMKEIACLLGFSEISTFSRAVKNWFGMPPKALRKRVHELPSARKVLLKENSPAP